MTLFTSGTLLAGLGVETSRWWDVSGAKELIISREHAGGVYALEIEWSRDGVTADITDTVEFPANDDIVREDIAGTFVRFRIRNTDAIAAFTAHRTVVTLK